MNIIKVESFEGAIHLENRKEHFLSLSHFWKHLFDSKTDQNLEEAI